MADGVRFGLLGPLEMRADSASVALGTPKQRAVLALLLINRNRPVSNDVLVGAAWNDEPPVGARPTLHCYISNLRRIFSSVGADPHRVLASAPHGYRLAVADDGCDLDRFNTEKTAGFHAAAAGRFGDAGSHLSAALSEWRGRVLEDLGEFHFVDGFASALVEDKIIVQTARAAAEIACGRAYSMIPELEGLVAEHPYREPLWAQLITAYYLSERQSDALEACRRVRTALADDLGVDPGPTIQVLHERILRHQPLDGKEAARLSAEDTIEAFGNHAAMLGARSAAFLHEASGHDHFLAGAATRIGRNPDNDIVLSDNKVSRNHAVIVDTGTGFVITDLGSANGVFVLGRRIHGSGTLGHGDDVRIGDQEFTFHTTPAEAPATDSPDVGAKAGDRGP